MLGVLNLHMEGFSAFSSLVLALLSVCPSFASLLFSLLSFSLPSLVFSLFSLSNNDNDHSSSRLSRCTHGSNLPECQSACTLAHSLFGELFLSCKKHVLA